MITCRELGADLPWGMAIDRSMADLISAVRDVAGRATALVAQPEVDPLPVGRSDTAARAVLRGRRRCGFVPNAGQEQESVRP
jgi:hypothetical protein